MKNELYILVELSNDIEGFGASITSRILEVSKNGNEMVIVKSEYDYLGSDPIDITLEEDEFGIDLFSFNSNDEEQRLFITEDAESSEYVEGDVIQDDKEVGEFIFRKITNIEWP